MFSEFADHLNLSFSTRVYKMQKHVGAVALHLHRLAIEDAPVLVEGSSVSHSFTPLIARAT